MKVALLAFSVRGAMGQYLEALVPPLSQHLDLSLYVPEHFEGNVPVKVVRFPTGASRAQALRRFLDPRPARTLWQKILTEKPDCLYLFNGEGYPWALWLARWAKKEGVPLFLTLHDPDPHPGNPWEAANALLRRWVVPLATSVHVHSQVFVDKARKLGARHVVVIPHGSFADRFLRHAKPGVQREEDLVLFFGRLEAFKGIDILVKAILALEGRRRALIAGPGQVPRILRRAMREHPSWFEVHNRYVPDEEAALFFQRASVLVLPYRQATQSSLPLIGAAFGLAVVASAVGAFVEDVPRVGGILVPPNNPQTLAQVLAIAKPKERSYHNPDLTFQLLARQFVAWLEGGLRR